MKLIIDIGNTRIKAALFEEEELKEFFVYDTMEELLKASIFQHYKINYCIVASVVNKIDSFVNSLKTQCEVLVFTSHTAIPINNLYQSANTIGSDRLAVAVGANAMYKNKNVLAIDAGTCIKYNFINTKNEFVGGAISPGLQMRFKALHMFTARLPLIEIDEKFKTLIGKNTTESILSGVQITAIAEVKGIIEQYKQLFPDILVILTGGDFNFFATRLKNHIFADQNLILRGLNTILDYNLKQK